MSPASSSAKQREKLHAALQEKIGTASCLIGRVTAPLGFWPFFGANCASRFFCSLSG
jgi:hypothetical protein